MLCRLSIRLLNVSTLLRSRRLQWLMIYINNSPPKGWRVLVGLYE
jgi:hypothetical protein